MSVTLSSGDLSATFHPELGMIGSSLTHRGDELLGQRKGLDAYAKSGSTMGIPLLYPWANRLSGFTYEANGERVTLDPERDRLRLDPNGLPIHGLLAASPDWEAQHDGDRLVARLDFASRPAFPFPHELRMEIALDATTLTIATTVVGDGVPVSFGFHPYFTLPGLARGDWHAELPVEQRLPTGDNGIPTGAAEPADEPAGPLGERTYDDGYRGVSGPFALEGGGRRIEVAFERGYEYAQVYAPPDHDLICFEPMTAPTNALVTGDHPVAEGEYRAVFSIAVTDS